MQEVNEAADYGQQMGVEALSLSEVAARLDVSKGYVSRRAGEGKDVKGHDVATWAVRDGGGRVDHFRVPQSAFEDDTPDTDRENAEEEAPNAPRENAPRENAPRENAEEEVETMSVRDMARERRKRREEESRQRNQERLEADRKRRERSAQRHKERMERIKAKQEQEATHEASQDAESAPKSDEGGSAQEGTPDPRRSGAGASLLALGGAAVVAAFLGSE